MRGIRPTDRILIAGQTGKGKTTLAQWLALERLQPVRVIVFDPKAELSFPGVQRAQTPLELTEALHGPVVHYVPSGFDRDELEEACQIVWQTPGPYVWWIDEASELTKPNYCPMGLRLAVTQGRKVRKMVIALTQRLAEIHPVFKSQSEHIFIFTPPPVELDLKAISGNVRREPFELASELAELHAEHGDYSHLWYVRDTDELRRCAPLTPTAGASSPGPGRGEAASHDDDDAQESGAWQEEDSVSA